MLREADCARDDERTPFEHGKRELRAARVEHQLRESCRQVNGAVVTDTHHFEKAYCALVERRPRGWAANGLCL